MVNTVDSSNLVDPLVARNPDSLGKQAKTILDDNAELLVTDKTTVKVSEDKSESSFPAHDKTPHERRPGLGLKRAKFSAKPMPSQPDLCAEPSIDIDNLRDPDELFAAFERMENAKKELQRLKGIPFEEMDQSRVSLAARPQRPSLLGKSATYKHRSYSLTGAPLNDEVFMSSQEAYVPKIMSPTREDAILETNATNLSPREDDVKQEMSSKVSELDELLSINYDDYDGAGIQNLLREKLNIKLLDIGEPSLPVMPNFRRREYGSFVETLPNMKDSIFGANDNSKATSSKPLNFNYQFRRCSNNQASPSLCKSPLVASISKLKKHISKLTPLKDPFSLVDVDYSPEVISYQKFKNRKQTDQIGKRINSHEEETKDSHEFGRSPVRGEEDIGVSGEILPSMIGVTSVDTFEWVDEIGQTAQATTSKNLFKMRFPAGGKENFENSIAGAEKNDVATNAPTQEDQIASNPKFVGKEVSNEGSALEKISVHGGEDVMVEPQKTQAILIEKYNKKKAASSKSKRKEKEKSTTLHQENIYEETMKKRRKGKAKSKSNASVLKESKDKKRKADGPVALLSKVHKLPRRQSLSGSGTKWEAGVRRSTRIRMRPLEFWKGERFLYGRVHDGMVSVIGVKYASPTKNAEEPAVMVKSFVSNKYKNLIDLASSH